MGRLVFGVGPYLSREEARREGEQAFLDAWLKGGNPYYQTRDDSVSGDKEVHGTCQTG